MSKPAFEHFTQKFALVGQREHPAKVNWRDVEHAMLSSRLVGFAGHFSAAELARQKDEQPFHLVLRERPHRPFDFCQRAHGGRLGTGEAIDNARRDAVLSCSQANRGHGREEREAEAGG